MNYIWLIFFTCLIVGIFPVIIGFSKFSDPSKSKYFFFSGGLLFFMPMVIALMLITFGQIKLTFSMPGYEYIPLAVIIFEVILFAVFFFVCLGITDDRVARNATLVFSIFFCIQLIVLLYLFTMMLARMEPVQ